MPALIVNAIALCWELAPKVRMAVLILLVGHSKLFYFKIRTESLPLLLPPSLGGDPRGTIFLFSKLPSTLSIVFLFPAGRLYFYKSCSFLSLS